MKRTHSLSNFEDRGKMTSKELERARKEYLKLTLVNEVVPSVEELGCNRRAYDVNKGICRTGINGNYAIVDGRKILMEQYGELVSEENEEMFDMPSDFQMDKRWREILNESY